jgi:hypothetical protein
MLLVYVTLFVIASVLAALAFTPGFFIAGHVLQGLTTSLMLIAAVPPLVTGWPAKKMPITGTVMNLCIFGAVALGPVVGGMQAGAEHWRPLLWIVAGIGGAAFMLALLTYEDQPPQDHSAPWDWVAVVLAGGGTAAAFFGASELQTHPLLHLTSSAPRCRRALTPRTWRCCCGRSSAPRSRRLSCSARCSGPDSSPCSCSSARSRSPVAPRSSQASSTGRRCSSSSAPVWLASASGRASSPALIMTGFSLPSGQIQRVFALVELLRGVAAFIAGPLLVHLATTVGSGPAAGTATAIWVCLGLAGGGGIVALCLFVLGRGRLQPPDLETWERGEEPALHSPPLAARIRGETPRLGEPVSSR